MIRNPRSFLLYIFFACFTLSVIGSPPSETDNERYLVIISVDGFKPVYYLDETFPAPMMQHMASEGAHARKMRGVFPSSTYPSHTSLATGVGPGRHGVYFNTRVEDGSYYFEYDSIRVETIMDVAIKNGLVTANIGWPVTLHAPFSVNVPISGALANSGLSADPVRDFTTPAGYFEELEREAVGKLTPWDLSNANLSKEPRMGEIAAYTARKYRPHIMLVCLQVTDSYQHRYDTYHFNVKRAVASADRAISRIVEEYDKLGILDKTTFIVAGDHGFVGIHTVLAPNVWLEQAGINTDRSKDNWQASFITTGGAAFLYINDDIIDEATLELIDKTIQGLPYTYQRQFIHLNRDELNYLSSNPEAYLALSGSPGIAFTADQHGPVQRKSNIIGAHGHLSNFEEMMIGFIAWGAGVKNGLIIPEMDLIDVAPTAARFLGLELDEAEGRAIESIYE